LAELGLDRVRARTFLVSPLALTVGAGTFAPHILFQCCNTRL
jgi:hypothetical protein